MRRHICSRWDSVSPLTSLLSLTHGTCLSHTTFPDHSAGVGRHAAYPRSSPSEPPLLEEHLLSSSCAASWTSPAHHPTHGCLLSHPSPPHAWVLRKGGEASRRQERGYSSSQSGSLLLYPVPRAWRMGCPCLQKVPSVDSEGRAAKKENLKGVAWSGERSISEAKQSR